MRLIDNGTQGGATVPAPQAAIGTPGYANSGTPGTFAETILDPDVFNALLAEAVNVVQSTGLTLNRTVYTLLLQAINRLAGSNVTSVTATGALTADNAGTVLVNATSGNVSITLPASASANGVPIRYRFVRTDSSVNIVSIVLHAGDAMLLGAAAMSVSPMSVTELVGDGGTQWAALAQSGGMVTFGSFGTYTFTPPESQLEVEVWGGGGAGGGSTGSSSAASGGGGAGYSRGRFIVTPGVPISVTVGAAGVGGTGSANGTAGGTSSFGAYCTATGGGAGSGISSGIQTSFGAAGAGSGGTFNVGGQTGSAGIFNGSFAQSGFGGAAFGAAGGPSSTSNGGTALAPGGGGAGGANGGPGADGGTGIVNVRW